MKKISDKSITLKDPESGYEKKVSLKKYRLENGIVDSFFINEGSNSVQVFALTEDNKEVILVKQFRPNNESECLELPGGGINKNEDPAIAAARELFEETGYEGSELIDMGSSFYGPYDTGKKYMFCALNCKKISKNLDLDDNELLKVIIMPLSDFIELIIKKGNDIRGVDLAYRSLHLLSLI